MPKQRITKEMIVNVAFELSRKVGMEHVTVKDVAGELHCSVQPIYSYCESMDGLHKEVLKKTAEFMKEYLAGHIDREDFFRSTGYAYIRLAKEEPNIFKMFIMHEREGITSLEDIYKAETNPGVADFIAKNLQITREKAVQLHLNMLIYTVGIGSILASSSPGIPTEEVYRQLESAQQAFLKQALEN